MKRSVFQVAAHSPLVGHEINLVNCYQHFNFLNEIENTECVPKSEPEFVKLSFNYTSAYICGYWTMMKNGGSSVRPCLKSLGLLWWRSG